jgi:V/A-type H+-transporting ATPase subunit I
MLSDAGYGLLMVIGVLAAKAKLRLSAQAKKTADMFLFCGVATVFWGALFGSWFGDLAPTIARQYFGREMGSLALWLDPVEKAMSLMLWCFLFGIVHLFAGYAVRAAQLWRRGKKADAVCDSLFVCLFTAGLAPLGASLLTPVPAWLGGVAKWVLLAGALGIVLTAGRKSKRLGGKLGVGLYGLYNAAAGMLGDVLSYSRLLALGLATGIIAQVVNLLGTMPKNMAVKSVALPVVLLVGHGVNMAINLIGAYVHTNRLQYVEFFSKFYEGGGRKFLPFAAHTKYYQVKEEAVHG